ncbi:hypothetical protein PGB90_008845 [Kerria lacca]
MLWRRITSAIANIDLIYFAFGGQDVIISDELSKEFEPEKHIQFIKKYSEDKSSYEYYMTEYLRMSGLYWGLTTLELLDKKDLLSEIEVMEFIRNCINDNGGISPSIDHDPHILYTLSAVQVACILNREYELPTEKIVNYIKGLQQPNGGFFGDKWGELDTRFSFCAVACLALLGKLDSIDLQKALEFVMSCHNFDGGFGSRPDSESHAGLTYCCVGFLSVTGNLHLINADILGYWLCERQLLSGGLNGRPEKLPDVCYSWWVFASLHMIGREHWINHDALKKFILACQDTETGGFSDRPGNMADPFHTLFGIAALSLMNHNGIKLINPCFCMPQHTISRLNLTPQILPHP